LVNLGLFSTFSSASRIAGGFHVEPNSRVFYPRALDWAIKHEKHLILEGGLKTDAFSGLSSRAQ